MKAYNTPKDELHIESDTGETLVSITPEKTTIANLEGGGSSDYDLVFEATAPLENASAPYITVTKGDFDSAYSQFISNKALNVKVVGKSFNETGGTYSEGFVSYISATPSSIIINITFVPQSRFDLCNATITLFPDNTVSYAKAQVVGD